jgi:hypothetical protein
MTLATDEKITHPASRCGHGDFGQGICGKPDSSSGIELIRYLERSKREKPLGDTITRPMKGRDIGCSEGGMNSLLGEASVTIHRTIKLVKKGSSREDEGTRLFPNVVPHPFLDLSQKAHHPRARPECRHAIAALALKEVNDISSLFAFPPFSVFRFVLGERFYGALRSRKKRRAFLAQIQNEVPI